jgi:hypothetical protein
VNARKNKCRPVGFGRHLQFRILAFCSYWVEKSNNNKRLSVVSLISFTLSPKSTFSFNLLFPNGS